ncbi:hypothetical protein AGMMS50267_14880 [Spirochaetia bacterium]|nr:hypothetical protein AGMMS50267_14880 [Spirochaetia bacterium]
MKKFMYLALAFGVAILAVSCVFQPDFPTSEETPIKVSESAEFSRKDVLALSHLQTEHIIGEEGLKNLVLDFMGGSTPARNAVSPDSVITGVTKLAGRTDKGFVRSLSTSRTVLDEAEPAEIPFYVFTIGNGQDDTKGFALTCGDDRIGNVLAVVEKGSYDDEENPYLPIFYSYLDQYITDTIDIYNSITEEDIAIALAKAENPPEAPRSVIPIDANVSFYDIDSVKDLNKGLLKTDWDQGDSYAPGPYNAIIFPYITGCVATAAAQIMAYHEFPNYLRDNGVSTGIQYEWNLMKADAWYKYEVAWLMWEIGLRVGMSWGVDKYHDGKGSSASIANVPAAFVNMGYVSPIGVMDYDFGAIAGSINADRPVIASGAATKTTPQFLGIQGKPSYSNGHAWVIDGYRARYIVVNQVIINPQSPILYVHCNLGWGGTCDGWYFSGVFYALPGQIPEPDLPVSQRSTVERFYQYQLKIIPYVYPHPVLKSIGY